jgi:hypothetical protein
MPGSRDGQTLAAAIRMRWPPIQIILTSGHYKRSEVTVPVGGAFFAKPYDRQAVISTMRTMVA